MTNTSRRRWWAVAAIIAATAVVGCGEQPGQDHGPMQGLTASQQQQALMDKIKNNPNMPQAAKDAAMGTIMAHAQPGAPKK